MARGAGIVRARTLALIDSAGELLPAALGALKGPLRAIDVG